MYAVVGYDKDNDDYVEYGKYSVFNKAKKRAEELLPYLNKDILLGNHNEPVDWLEVYWNWDGPEEEVVWSSY